MSDPVTYAASSNGDRFEVHCAGGEYVVLAAGDETPIDEAVTVEEARASALSLALAGDIEELAGEVASFASYLATLKPDSRRENAALLAKVKDLLVDARRLIDRESDRTGFPRAK